MPWLSNQECLQYAPGITLTGEPLTTAIALAQSLVEGINGANRPLEITQYKKILTIPNTGRVIVPIRPMLSTPAPVVELRGSDTPPRFGVYSIQEWEPLILDKDYKLDYDNNEISLLALSRVLQHEYYYHTGFRRYSRNPTVPRVKKQLKITYSSGINFAATSETVVNLKRSLAAIVALRASPQSQGVKSVDVSDDSYSVEYASQSDYLGISGNKTNGSPINELLSIFRKYRPSEYTS